MWQPLTEEEMLNMIDNAEWMMEPPVRALWYRIKIQPQKWQLSPDADLGGGFWVVAIVGQWCLFYNDIEEGFNGSQFVNFGQIGQNNYSQSDLLSFVRAYHRDFTEAIATAV
jgi:hypothetical protein